ncbi:hypothetical protein OG342_05545 [Streptomyces bobili]|uniref:hypothetical protein n=1 Tax=Streptomyces bobili TaxID=67280 RepID=UPI0022588D9C|nr:hypothetical protein [Streptomyces bobili]MCX5522329.1 hypothetical protein [Streptomyces bobili]
MILAKGSGTGDGGSPSRIWTSPSRAVAVPDDAISRFGVYATDKITITPEQYDANSSKRGPSWRSGGRSATVCRRRGIGRLTVRFRPGGIAYAVVQLGWRRARFFASRPGDRPAACEPSGRACVASK